MNTNYRRLSSRVVALFNAVISNLFLRSGARRMGLVLLVTALISAPAWPQFGNGSVRGTVFDPTSAVIPNAPVLLTNTATGVVLKTDSNSAGIFVFPAVSPGPYRLEVSSAGMKKYEKALEVQAQNSTTVDVTLQLAGSATSVDVQGEATPQLTTDSAVLGNTLERARIEQLPINGRKVTNLLYTVQGMQNASGGTGQNGGWRVYGARAGTFDIVLDGSALTERMYENSSISRLPSLDSIQEFRVEVNANSAKGSRQGMIVLITKGGTNQLHGSLFETNRNNAYGVARARNNFSNTPTKLIRNEYGGTVGGPIWIPKLYNGKNKTFWFFNYEGMKQRAGSISEYAIPTAAMRAGDFSGLKNSAGVTQVIYDPLTTGSAPNYVRQPFTYNGKLNNIDPARLSPLMKYIYSDLPLPNIPGVTNPLLGNNYSTYVPTTDDQYTWGARFDQQFGDRDRFNVRITRGNGLNYNPGSSGIPTPDGFTNQFLQGRPNESMSWNWNHTLSPTFNNEWMFSASRSESLNSVGTPGRFYSDELGLPNPGHTPGYPVVGNICCGGTPFQPLFQGSQYMNYFIMEDNATKVKGRHELQFGFHVRYEQDNMWPQQSLGAGQVTFQSITTAQFDPANSTSATRVALPNTGHVAAAAYLGYATYQNNMNKGMYYMRQWEDALYFQDNFRPTKRLTLNLGVRWQILPYPADKYNIMSGFDFKNMAITLGNSLDTFYKLGATNPTLVNLLQSYGVKFQTYKEAGLPPTMVYTNYHDISPHIGFAYRALDGRRSVVLRGGFSTNYNPIPIYGWQDRMRLNSPFQASYTNNRLTAASESPDGLPNYGLISAPTVIAGLNSIHANEFSNPQGVTPGTSSFQVAWFSPHQPSARVDDWNITLEREIMPDTILRAGFVGNHSFHQDSYNDLNPSMNTYTWVSTKHLLPLTGTASNTGARVYPNTPYANLQEYARDGFGWSNGIHAQIERRYSKGFSYQVMYTLMNVMKAAEDGWYEDSQIPPVQSFLPGTVPTNVNDRIRLLKYGRDVAIPQHEIRWNWVAELPLGKGKAIAGNAGTVLNKMIGGWQVAGMGRWRSTWITLPTSNWPTGMPVEYYGHKYPIQDCRSGACRPGYLMWNGYIPAYQINSVDSKGNPNGVMGVPKDYKPAVSPLWPYPSNYPSLSSATDPNYANYGTNYVWLPVTDSPSTYRLNLNPSTQGSPLSPWINQAVASTNIWICDASLYKSFSIRERVQFRFQADFFNVFNMPGNNGNAGADGVLSTYTGANSPRVVQLGARLTW